MMKIPPRLWRMLLSYVLGPLLHAFGSGLSGLVRRLLGRDDEPQEPPELPKVKGRRKGSRQGE